MTNPDARPDDAPPRAPDDIGNALRAASTILWLVGILTVLIAIAVDGPQLGTGTDAVIRLLVDVASGLVVIGSGMLVRRGRRIGAVLAVAAWALQALSTLPATGHVRAPSPLITVAVLLVAFNWRRLR